MSTAGLILENDVRIPADVFNLRAFRAWAHSKDFPERGKITYVAGQIEVDMSPEEIQSHSKVKGAVYADLYQFVRRHDLGELLPDGAFLVNEEADLATEPDMLFCSWERLESGAVRYGSWGKESERKVEVVGSPDLVVEVVSRSSVNKDTVRMKKAYFAADVAEYWLIDARGGSVDFQILTRGRRAYSLVTPDSSGYCLSTLFKRRFRVVQRRNRVGTPTYRLMQK